MVKTLLRVRLTGKSAVHCIRVVAIEALPRERRFWLTRSPIRRSWSRSRRVSASVLDHQVVVENGVGFHSCDDDGWPAGLQRALTDATIATSWSESLDASIDVPIQQCAWLETQHGLLTRHTLFQGWPLCRNEPEPISEELRFARCEEPERPHRADLSGLNLLGRQETTGSRSQVFLQGASS